MLTGWKWLEFGDMNSRARRAMLVMVEFEPDSSQIAEGCLLKSLCTA
jgi:hypothetical protein